MRPGSHRAVRSVTVALCVFALATGAALTAAAPAAAATSGGTAVTFALTAGPLSITVPASAALGNGAAAGTLTASLGSVVVSDQRGLLVDSWTATASTSTFTTGGGTTAETIPTSAVSYQSGTATSATGLNLIAVPGQAATPAPMANPVTAYTVTAGVGNDSVTWNPTISIAVPSSAVAGSYSGTITHSVA